MAIADAEGMAALSMRKVASSLGVGAMSLYTYVPGRSELVELMIDRVYGEHALPDPELPWQGSNGGLERPGGSMVPIRGCWTTTWRGFRSGRTCSMFPRRLRRVARRRFTGAENVTISNDPMAAVGRARSMISDADEARHTGVSAEATGIPVPASG